MREDRAVLSNRIGVIEGDREVPGFLLFLPVYAKGRPAATVAEREAALQGWIYASIRMDALTTGLEAVGAHQLDLTVLEDSQLPGQPPLFETAFARAPRDAQALVNEASMDVYGRRWLFQFRSRPEFQVFSSRALPWVVLLAGLLAGVLSSLLVLASANARGRAEVLADRMTEELSRANADLERAIASARQSEAEARQAREGGVSPRNRLGRLFQLGDGVAGLGLEQPSAVSGPHAAAGAVQERHAERRFQMGHALTDHRLGQLQALRRGADAAVLHHREEGADVVQTVFHRCASVFGRGERGVRPRGAARKTGIA